ncbi:MAG: oligosaccharide flippase family protein [Synergistaceae bacterium]|nr:oligosaccharide flippase family protein [Synergistaceae bacterium]
MKRGKTGGIKQIGIKYNLFFLSLVKICTYLFPLITAPYLSRILGPYGIGKYTFCYSIVSFFALFVNFGFPGYGALKISVHKEDLQLQSNYFWSIIYARGILFLLASVAYFAVSVYLFQHNGRDFQIYLILYLAIGSYFFDISFLYQGLENFKVISVTNMAVRSIATILLFIFVKSINDIVVYATIQATQLLLIAVLPWVFVKRTVEKISFSSLDIGTTIKNAFMFFLPTLAVSFCALVDKTMLGTLSTNMEVGFYEQADKIVVVIINLLHSIVAVYFSKVSLLIANGNEEEAKNKICSMSSLYFLFGFPLVLGLYAIGAEFIVLFFGEAFIPAIKSFYLLIPIILLTASSNAIGNIYYSPRGKIWMTSVFYFVGATLNIFINALMIPYLGSFGASLASLISEMSILVLFIIFSHDKMDYIRIVKEGVKPFLSAIIMFFVLLCFSKFMYRKEILTDMSKIFIKIIIGALSYFLFLLVMREKLAIQAIRNMKNKIKGVVTWN